MADMMQGQDQAAAGGQGQDADVGKLIQGVGMGLQKLAEVLPPELAGKINELVTEFQNILQGNSEEEPGEEAAPAAAPRGGRVDMMGGANGRPMMQ